MKKFINDVDNMLRESLSGLGAAHADILKVTFDPTFVTRARRADGKVALISGGGSGHEPLHAGYVGRGMLDAACPGQVFTSPTPDQMLAAAEAVDGGKGVLFIVKNYSGDTMNFQMATEMIDVDHATVLVNDDVAVENSTHTTGRRGVAGTLMVEKMIGAAAEAGAALLECKAVGDRVNAATASMGVAFTSCTVPAAGRTTFDAACASGRSPALRVSWRAPVRPPAPRRPRSPSPARQQQALMGEMGHPAPPQAHTRLRLGDRCPSQPG